MKLYLAALSALMLLVAACYSGESGPPIANADLRIDQQQVPAMIDASQKFASQHNLRLSTSKHSHDFTIYMTKGAFSMSAISSSDPTVIYLTAWDKGQHKPENIALAERYFSEMERVTGRAAIKTSQ